jgi:ATP-dependent helicase HepA
VNNDVIKVIDTEMDNLLKKKYSKKYDSKIDSSEKPESVFNIGDLVKIKSNPDTKGAIINIQHSELENKYYVFINGKTEEFYESQLEKIFDDEPDIQSISLNYFNAHISSLQILNPHIAALYSLNSAFIDFVPYQYRPVLKFINADRPRLLIADEVGIGKTIESAIILRELQARQEIKSVLVICPKPLITEKKWYNELKRFNEEFVQLDSKGFDFCIDEFNKDGIWPGRYSKAIIPYSIFDEDLLYGKENSSVKGLLDLDPPPSFDLIIVDEAHRIKNHNTITHKTVRLLCDNSENVIFLTATPIQLGNQDLYNLLNVLRPDYIIDPKVFEAITEPNFFINKAIKSIRLKNDNWMIEALEELINAKNTIWGHTYYHSNQDYHDAIEVLTKNEVSDEERVNLIQKVEQLHTLSSIINRTRRRDIGEFTIRNPHAIEVRYTKDQQELYDRLISFRAKILTLKHGDKNIKFMMTTLLRQTSSCLFGLLPLINDILERHLDDIDFDEIDSEENSMNFADDNSIRDELNDIKNYCNNLDLDDEKFEKFYEIIEFKSKMSNRKVLVFSSFKHTIFYLKKKLDDKGIRSELIYGDVKNDDRMTIQERFRLPTDDINAIDVLLSSEIGAEGLDYQFCDTIINYDLPWNPMRIEQRIGRIDRYGQESETIAIYNFLTHGTIDKHIYDICLSRIGIFESSIGGSEEILGQIAKEIKDIAEDFNLTEKQKIEKLKQLADNKIVEIKEKEKIEAEHKNLFSIDIPPDVLNSKIEEITNYWLKPELLKNLIELYFQSRFDKKNLISDKDIFSIKLNEEQRRILLEDFRKLELQRSPVSKFWESWLKGNSPNIKVTFNSSLVKGKRDVTLISPIHPLAKQAAEHFGHKQPVYLSIKYIDNSMKSGNYPFALYLWSKQGQKTEISLQPISKEKFIIENFIKIVKIGSSKVNVDFDLIDDKKLDDVHFTIWKKAKESHIQKVDMTINNLIKTLSISHENRMRIIDRDLNSATNEKIIKMKKAQKDNAVRDFQNRVSELEKKKTFADISFEIIAYGIINVENIND